MEKKPNNGKKEIALLVIIKKYFINIFFSSSLFLRCQEVLLFKCGHRGSISCIAEVLKIEG